MKLSPELHEEPTPAAMAKLLNAVLLESAQKSLDAMNGELAAIGKKPFNYDDETVFGLVERSVAAIETVALAVIPLGFVEVIQSPLLEVVGSDSSARRVMVIPCADVAQLRRVALQYGDDRAQRKLFGL
jgi:hypothetical protein